jgi:formylglycine-generating enzyme required for sulfatase activity
MRTIVLLAALALSSALGATACTPRSAPPLGEVLVVVDTNVPAPAFAGRLRVDLYDESGAWIDSADFVLPNADDWPTSFAIYTDGARRRVLARLRAYPEGKVRDYRGERFEARPTFEEPHLAASVDELCANPPVLELGKTLRLRVGSKPNLDSVSHCGPRTGGAALAAFDVPTTGKYELGAIATEPMGSPFLLEAFDDCHGAEVSCVSFVVSYPMLPGFDTVIPAGRHFLAVQDVFRPAGAFDVVLGFAKNGHFGELPGPDPPPPADPPDEPRLIKDGRDVTPLTEPSPNLAIDRLVLVDLDANTFGAARVLLDGACLGTMAALGTTDPQRPAIAEASTCVSVENERAPVAPAAIDPDRSLGTSKQGTFGEDALACPTEIDPNGRFACVAGGLFVLGTPVLGGLGVSSTVPERPAVMPTFWIDRYEVTVADYRQAVAEGLQVAPSDGPGPNPDANPSDPSVLKCNYTLAPGMYEDHAVNCLTWRAARAYCQFRGGDLPTEAEWEFTAKAASRPRTTPFPWGDDAPACSCDGSTNPCHAAIVSTEPGGVYPVECPGVPDAARGGSVKAREGAHGDVAELTPGVFVVGLGGGVSEMTLDALRGYDDPCWLSSSLTSPRCFESDPPAVTARGGRLTFPPGASRAEQRSAAVQAGQGTFAAFDIGFRCAYVGDPR